MWVIRVLGAARATGFAIGVVALAVASVHTGGVAGWLFAAAVIVLAALLVLAAWLRRNRWVESVNDRESPCLDEAVSVSRR